MYYNSLQYSYRVWLTSALAIPHVYLLYYVITNGSGAYIPINSYIELLTETLLFSMPIGLVFILVMDMMCKTTWSVNVQKVISLTVMEILLLLVFTLIIHGIADKRASWESCFDYVVISSFTIAICTFMYKLQPVKPAKRGLAY
jgi:uncharacterized membrane protein YecN with MAPEG domain